MERLIVKEKGLDILIYRVEDGYEAHAQNKRTGRVSIARGPEKWSTISEGIQRALSPRTDK